MWVNKLWTRHSLLSFVNLSYQSDWFFLHDLVVCSLVKHWVEVAGIGYFHFYEPTGLLWGQGELFGGREFSVALDDWASYRWVHISCGLNWLDADHNVSFLVDSVRCGHFYVDNVSKLSSSKSSNSKRSSLQWVTKLLWCQSRIQTTHGFWCTS